MAKAANALAQMLKKKIGGNDSIQTVKHWLDTGFKPLNKAISGSYNGGVPCGRMTEIYGGSSSGKTLIATQMMISAQKKGGIAVFLDHENSFDSNLASAYGLYVDDDLGNWVYKQPETFEDSMTIFHEILKLVREENLIDADAPIVFVFDSLASMIPRSKAEKLVDNGQLGMNDNTALARCTAAHFPTMAMLCRKYSGTAVFLNQIRTNLAVSFGDQTKSTGGAAPEFYSSVRVALTRAQIKEGSDKVGQKINARIVKNKTYEPFKTASWDYYYATDKGFDVIGSSLDYLAENDKIEKTGGYFIWEGKKLRRKELVARLQESPELLNELFID